MSIRLSGSAFIRRDVTAAALAVSGAITICGWVKFKSKAAYDMVATLHNATGSSGDSLAVHLDGAGAALTATANAGGLGHSNINPPIDGWRFFAFVKQASTTGNGAHYGGDINANPLTSNPALSLGFTNPFNFVTVGAYYDGSLDADVEFAQVRIWTAELAEAQLRAERDSPTAVITSNLYLSWPLANASDTSDASGNGRTWTATGTVTTGADNPPNASTGPTITDVGDEQFYAGETGVVITGSNFGATQGTGLVRISPSNDPNDSGAVAQTVTAWSATSITITAVRGTLPYTTNCYLFVRNNAGSWNVTGHVVQFNDDRPSISNADDEQFYAGETGVHVTGVRFGAVQGGGGVYLSPTNNPDDAGRVAQTVTNWSATDITITIVRGSLSLEAQLYLFVIASDGKVNPNGYAVQLTPRVYIRERLIDLEGAAVANESGLTAIVYVSVPTVGSPNPQQVLTGLTTDAEGDIDWEINRGALPLNGPCWLAVFKDGSPARGTLRKVTPQYI